MTVSDNDTKHSVIQIVVSFLSSSPRCGPWLSLACAEKFSSSGEYDVECTSIFQSFQAQTEEALNTGLIERLAWFEMDDFLSLVAQRGDELHSDVFDVLMTMSEFEEFADLMSSFRDEKYGSGRLGDLSLALSVTSLAADALQATESCTADGEGKQQAAEHK